jgi:hypothetical protein
MTNPTADTLAAAAKAAGKKGPPPVHLWNPPFCGDIDMRIARDGTWFYLGTPIGRAPLVKLFSSILKREEGDDYFLVTPVEKVGIKVDDAPLLAIDFDATGEGTTQTLTFTTKTEDEACLAPTIPCGWTRDPETGEPSPYVLIRANLWALIDRKSFYRLIDLGCHHDHDGQSGSGFGPRGSSSRSSCRRNCPEPMPRFAANLTYLFTEVPVLDRPDWAQRCGFDGVEMLFPYDHPMSRLGTRAERPAAGADQHAPRRLGQPATVALPPCRGWSCAFAKAFCARRNYATRLRAGGCMSWPGSPRDRRPSNVCREPDLGAGRRRRS